MTPDYAKRLLDPEDLGLAVTAEQRDDARIVLGIKPVESHLAKKLDPSIACQSCAFRPSHNAGYAPECTECWTAYFVDAIHGVGKFGANPQKVRERVIEELQRSST